MDRGTVTRIEEQWDLREAGDGRGGLAKLGDTEFSGAVEAGGAWLFMLNGRIVGSSGGSEETIGPDEPLTAYAAPHPSLPLLFAMRDRGGETQARYFTDDTPLSEVHETLSSGSFTGYVELSENVHSGDYYVVYYGGRALYVAFIGNAERLVTGDEAFERANDEVGIYEVTSVDLDVRDAPDVEDVDAGAVGAIGSGEADSSGSVESGASTDETDSLDAETADSADPELADAGDADPDAVGSIGSEIGTDAESEPEPEADTDVESGAGLDADASGGADDASQVEPAETGEGGGGITDSFEVDAGDSTPADGDDSASEGDAAGSTEESRFSDEAAWREQRTVPALDPERSETSTAEAETTDARHDEPTPSRGDATADPAPDRTGEASIPEGDRVDELEAEIESLRERVESLSEERDELRAERDRLRTRVSDLEATGGGAGSGDGRDLTPEAALGQTDLLVRYGSKSEATLEDAHDGDASPEAVGANLRLKAHTRFDADAATVNGEAFESFMEGTLAYRFVRWLTEDLLFEIRETENRTELRDLYDALPEIDRAEFDGTVTVEGETGERSLAFDVVVRDQMGQPLLVADVDGDRDPTKGEMMEGLLDRSTAIAEAADSLSCAFLVTASFFHNEVHEQVKGATRKGLLDRDSRTSFVKAARGGYHVCLIETHDGEFHVSRPDL